MTVEHLLALSRADDGVARDGLFAPMDRWLARWLIHPQDAYVLRHMMILAMVCGFAAYANLFFSWWYVAPLYLAIIMNGEAIGRFFHIPCHRKLFRKPLGWLNTAPTWLVSPWIGDPPFQFGAEHVANHHAQDNGPLDLSSTLGYQRDSWRDLGRYLLSFLVGRGGAFGLAGMFLRGRGGRVWRRRFFVGQAVFWTLVVVRLWFDWVATAVMLIGPYFLVQFFNRSNNWTEHAFINPDLPEHPLGNSYTIVNSKFNTGVGFNEGYHATHHIHPGIPNHLWPKYFRDRVDDYCRADHLVFTGTSTNDIFFMLMFKDFRGLAKHYVPSPGRPRDEAEIIALLRRRVAPVALAA